MNRKTLIIIICIVVILLIGWALLSRQQKSRVQVPKQASTAPSTLYTDPGGYYTIKAPSNWTKKVMNATGQTGIGTSHETTQSIEIMQASSAQRVGITIQVYEGKTTCNPSQKPNMTLAGLPTFYNPALHLWVVDTTDGTYVINYSYPGDGTNHGIGPAKQESFSPEEQSNARILLEQIIKSFLPKHAKATTC